MVNGGILEWFKTEREDKAKQSHLITFTLCRNVNNYGKGKQKY